MNDVSDTLIDTVPSLLVGCDGKGPGETYYLPRKVKLSSFILLENHIYSDV